MKHTFFFWLVICGLICNAQQTIPLMTPGKATLNGFPYREEAGSLQKAALLSTGDTLHYFFNKHFYRNPTPLNNQFFIVSSPNSGTNIITHCGAIFLNTNTVTVTGVEALVARHPASLSLNVPVRLYLCNVNGINQPLLPPIDSILTTVSSPQGVWVGGNFATPHTVNGKFAVLFKRGPSLSGDTAYLYLNNAAAPTSTLPAAQKFGEGLGVLRFNGNFFTNTNVFGVGTDHEFIVAPRVLFNFSAGFTVNKPTICNKTNGSYSANTVMAGVCDNRQFNFNKFAAYWSPFQNPPAITDSVYNWTFTGTAGGSSLVKNPTPLYNTPGNHNVSLTLKYWHSSAGGIGSVVETDATAINQAVTVVASPAVSLATSSNKVCTDFTGTNDVTLTGTPAGGVYTGVNVVGNQFSPTSSGTFQINYSYTDISSGCTGSVNASIVVLNCTGINKNFGGEETVSVYPNPSSNGQFTLKNIEPGSTVEVYNLLGERVFFQQNKQNEVKLDLSDNARGTYLIRLLQPDSKRKNIKIIF